MPELDRIVNGCPLPGFAGRSLPEWTAQALAGGWAAVCRHGANLAKGSVAEPSTQQARVCTEAVGEALGPGV